MITCSLALCNAFVNSFDTNSLDKMCTNVFVFVYRYMHNGRQKFLWFDISSFSLQKWILITLLKLFCEKLRVKARQFYDFSDWKHVKMTATWIKQSFFSTKFPEKLNLLLLKQPVTFKCLLFPLQCFCSKIKCI